MVLTADSDAGFNNERKARIRAGTRIFLYENEPIPRWNGPLLTTAKIMKYVMTLVEEAEMGAFF